MNVFKMRFEDKAGIITYRKHWIVLLLQTALPAALFFVSLGLTINKVTHLHLFNSNFTPASGIDPWLAVFIMSLVFTFFWWIYQYWDWSNDIFQVTQDQVLDIERKPLGREEKKSALLDNILSTQADRRGLFQIIFNYGNVYIFVGATRMDFFDVYDPSGIQQDIDRRRMARIERKKQDETLNERERMAEFFAMYHLSSTELRQDQEKQAENPPKNPRTPNQAGDK
jgi:hypothetical protein